MNASCRRICALVMLAAPVGVRAQGAGVKAEELDSIIRKAVVDKQLIGVSVGVMENGKVILAKGYGVRDIASKAAVTPSTMFAIGSVTKQFTCSAMLMLAEQHKLSLKDPVSKYFPNLTRAKDITLIDLGGHLSGYRDYYPLDFVDQEMQKPQTVDAIITEYATRPLDFEPRSRYSYSNTGFLILGRVIEKVSGQPFGSVLSTRIFQPLNLSRTAYEPKMSGADMARGYTSFALADPFPADPEAAGWAGPAGAIWSTPTDLLAWDRSLLDRKLLSDSSYKVLTTPQRLTDGRSSGYGCGEGVNDRGLGVVLSHGGAVSGFVAQNTVIPSTRSAVVVLSNSDFSPIGALNQELVAKVMPKSPDVPTVAGLSAIDAAKKFLTELERGQVDRASLGEDFSVFLTRQKIDAGKRALNAMGPISNVRIAGVGERGGMEVATVLFDVGKTASRGLLYRTPDGKVQEFLFSRN
ncbi:MAG TPA: serine hydrolase domain-containing protein [Gemmatimonadaceae bacterium]|jgi:D-alanyl-D-alanine carboxypeptidase|nr:serine hydrolase domain-containing protein [Gemmatimonadaceae bacterium]